MARGAIMTPERIATTKELLAAYPDKSYAEIGKLMNPPASAATVARVKRGVYDPKPEKQAEEQAANPVKEDPITAVGREVHDISNRISQVTELQHSQATKLNAMQDEMAALLETIVDLLTISTQVQGIHSQMQLDSMRDGFNATKNYTAQRRDRIAHLVKEAMSYAG